MTETLDKIFNKYTLLVLNAMIILGAEFLGGGKFLYDSGLIHIIAILFVILSIFRIFLRYYTYDPVLEKFINACAVAFIIFGLSHLIEFVSYVVLKLTIDTTFANVANFYIISLVIISFGAERFLRVADQRENSVLSRFFLFEIAVFAIYAVSIFFNSELVSLELNTSGPYIYILILAFVGSIAFLKVRRIGRVVILSRKFARYLLASIILIVLAALINVFYDPLNDILGGSNIQAIYLSHFAFYAALSLIFLSFKALSHLGGVYEGLSGKV